MFFEKILIKIRTFQKTYKILKSIGIYEKEENVKNKNKRKWNPKKCKRNLKNCEIKGKSGKNKIKKEGFYLNLANIDSSR